MIRSANEWLKRVHRFTEGAVELRACPNVRGQGRVPAIFTRDGEDIDRFVEQWDRPGYGVFFGVASRKPDTTPPGNIATTMELPAVWIDRDGDKDTAPFLGCYAPPSVIVDSGGGVHAYWLLDEPEDVSAALTNEHPAVELMRQLRRIFDSDPAVCDLARIMRLPGTRNTKRGDPAPVGIIHESGRTYSLGDLREWVGWQRELIGPPVDPFLAAAEKLGVKPALDVEDALRTMTPGNIHERQLRISASLVSAGKTEDEILGVLLPATRLAIGEEARRWNWAKEEADIRRMTRGAAGKFKVVDLEEHRRRTANGDGPAAARAGTVPTKEKEPAAGRAAKVALEVWGRPVIAVDGEPWAYADGVWGPVEGALEHALRAHIHAAARALGSTGNATLNGAWRWIMEDLGSIRDGVRWDRAGVIVGRNGALEVGTGRLLPHDPLHYATRKVDCDIDPAAACPRWLRFLADALPQDTERTVATLQEWFGAALVRGKARELSKGLLIHGPSYTGKTQVAIVARRLVGGKTCGLRVRAMSERFGMQPLVHASAWIADDAVSQHETMDAEAYKLIVTGESVSVERKNMTNLEVSFDLPVLLTMNNFPVVKDSSDAVYNRSLVLAMRAVRSERDAVPIGDLIATEELAGVLAWAVDGWRRLKSRGWYDPPEAMLAAGRDFKGGNNPFQEFCELCVVTDPDHMVLREDFRIAFNGWLKREVQARHEWSGKAVAQAIQNGLPKVRGDKIHKGRVWVGVALTEQALPYFDPPFGQAAPILADLNLGIPAEMRARLNFDLKRKTLF